MPFLKNFKLFDQLMRKFFVYIFTFLLVINVSVVTNAKNLKPEFLSGDQLDPLIKYEKSIDQNKKQHSGYILKLNEKYSDALGVAKARMVKIGAVRAVKSLEGEIDRIKANDTRRSKDIESAPDYVKKMRAQYDEFVKRVNNLKRSRDGEALYLADRGLAEVQLALTKSNEIDTALKLRQYREEFKRPPEPKIIKPPNIPNKLDDDIPLEDNPDPDVVLIDPDPDPIDNAINEPIIDTPVQFGYGDDAVRPMTAEEMEKFSAELGPPPKRSGKGYAAMIASIQRKEVTEISLGKIKLWGPARPQIWKNKPYWTATVTYPTTSLFGTFDTEGMAIMSGTRVLEWRYTGSGEEIP